MRSRNGVIKLRIKIYNKLFLDTLLFANDMTCIISVSVIEGNIHVMNNNDIEHWVFEFVSSLDKINYLE